MGSILSNPIGSAYGITTDGLEFRMPFQLFKWSINECRFRPININHNLFVRARVVLFFFRIHV